MKRKRRGIFITFEGPEGGGKSTQIKRFAAFLRRKGYSVLVLREPGGTKVSEAIRKIILHKRFTRMCPETELMLYLAARAQIVREKIIPALRKGKAVICDRFEDSTLAYQGYGRRFGVQRIEKVSREWVRGRVLPDLTFVLDIDPKAGMKRGGRSDRMENQTLDFHHRVRRGFLALARRSRKRYRVVDASKSKSEVFDQILKGSRNAV